MMWLRRRVLAHFLAWVLEQEGPGVFASALHGKITLYLGGTPNPPLWQPPIPFRDGDVISEW